MNHPAKPYTPIFARWKGYEGGDPKNRREFVKRAHVYEVIQRPVEPLAVGMKVTIYAVSPATYCSSHAPEDQLEAYDAHIVGRIVRIVGWSGETVQLEVKNECWKNIVRRAQVDILYLPDISVRRLAHWRAGVGPTAARDDALDGRRVSVLPPNIWSCGAGACVLREPGTVGDGILCVYWPTDVDPDDQAAADREQRPRKRRRIIAQGETAIAEEMT